MALISKTHTFSAGATIIASEHNTNFDTIYNDYNGNITNANCAAGMGLVDTKLAQITTSSKVSFSALISGSNPINENKGDDIASATTTDIGAANGNYVDVTGTTTITGLGTVQAGTRRIIQFDGALTLTHNGTSLILPGNANITTAAGDIATFVSLGSGNWVCTNYQVDTDTPSKSGQIIQVVNTQDGAVNTGSTAMVEDDSIPQNTEGDEYMTLAITPTSATNKLRIDIILFGTDSASAVLIAALFQDSTASALAAGKIEAPSANETMPIVFTHYMTAGTTSSTTFKVRAGSDGGTTFTFNGSAGSRLFGGVMASSITITEISA